MSYASPHSWPADFRVREAIGNGAVISLEDRYLYQKIEIEGVEYFHKKAQKAEVGELLDHDLAWVEYLNDLRKVYPELHVRPLEVYAYLPQQAIITEFINAPFVAEVHEMSKLEDSLERYVDLLVAMDIFGATWLPDVPIVPNSTTAIELDRKWGEWVSWGRLYEKGIVTPDEISKAHERVTSYHSIAESRMQHGDLGPWHIFDLNDEWVIFDAEHANDSLPRFYDLSWAYTRISTLGQDAVLARRLVEMFLDKTGIDPDSFFERFLPVVLSRSIGVLLDAENDASHVNYRQSARDLFSRALIAQNLPDLLG